MSASNAVEALLPKPSPAMVADTFKLVMTSANELLSVVAQEQTQRQEIRAWEKSQLEIIHVQRDFLLTALDKTFDERRENFRRLFDQLDAALVSDRDDAAAQVSDLLGAITDLAKTSPFKDLKSPTLVVQEFLKSGRVIEL
jgi:flagellar biosynthesis/type III secretory pathway chaperone